MGILRTSLALAATASACYEPELRDCTLSCTAASDCADGQVCGSDHFCAAPAIAGRCSSLPGNAGSNDRDGGIDTPTIRDATPDAATHVPLAIMIEGQGRVSVQGIGTCDKSAPQNGSCLFVVPIHVATTADAQAYSDFHFDKWTTALCASAQNESCTFTLTIPATLGVKFKKDD